jgi:hypothetical protein
MTGTSVEDFEVHIRPPLVLPYTLEQSKWGCSIWYILLNKQIREPVYVGAAGIYEERGGEERRLQDDISARC